MTPEPIFDTAYWGRRLRLAEGGQLHHSIFRCPEERWRRIEDRHREILKRHIKDTDGILDAGCGYGRLLTLLPASWRGPYMGVDLSPDFVERARAAYPSRTFHVADLRDLGRFPANLAEWAILISIRPMVKRNAGDEAWQVIEGQLRRVARRLLLLEYDEADEGSAE